ncbi:hypothetical protein C7U89_07660 [Bradyrhizobium sp. WBOS4]|nr:hypothetical protein [Bradyrhizobium sp. WBOS8]MDD1582825.1 hypothetical protein [Bradyrhizobium sp. WBOS4]UUO48316.1 hypothetical protein DCM78_16190 [Bradyrhizobium sp. WBOS04]UUO61937.1 hypothetical protein DCM80_23930 [Bradyrhizobium sp. WBOS08]
MIRDLDLAEFELHPQRGAVLAEVHARPFTRLTAPVTVLRFAFLGQGEVAAADRQEFVAFCTSHGQAPPEDGTKHHQVTIGTTQLRWEQHSEFSTFTWILGGSETSARRFGEIDAESAALIRSLRQSGQLLVAVKLEVEQTSAALERAQQLFERGSLAIAAVRSGPAVVASDFRTDDQGFVRILGDARRRRPQAQQSSPDGTDRIGGFARKGRGRQLVSVRRQPGLQRDRAGSPRGDRRRRDRGLSDLVLLPRPSHGTGHAHLCDDGGPAGRPVDQARARG